MEDIRDMEENRRSNKSKKACFIPVVTVVYLLEFAHVAGDIGFGESIVVNYKRT
jgi:hypothetical protein